MNNNYFSKRLKSFEYAINGLKLLFREEPNSVIHFIIAIAAIALGFVLKITGQEWMAIVLSIGFVFVMEIINTSVENICDFISPEHNIQIKKIKDLAAAGVLISSITALVVGLLVFVPKIL